MRRIGLVVATCGFVGYAPVAPGTFGSAAGLVLFAALRTWSTSAGEVVAVLLLFVVGAWSGTVAERHAGRTDPGIVVIDEVLGMLVTLIFLPVGVVGAVVGFLVFRVLDIVKPWPARAFERLPGGWGIMADDAMAGVYGNLVMRVLLLLPGLAL
ncbi:MAG: phosphatidylglycerophosphatase A [Acidobacteria bacterium]|nr:phosphatidylglycerophosphatase A [Acidobacteriota bacterium]